MSKYIDADELIEQLKEKYDIVLNDRPFSPGRLTQMRCIVNDCIL